MKHERRAPRRLVCMHPAGDHRAAPPRRDDGILPRVATDDDGPDRQPLLKRIKKRLRDTRSNTGKRERLRDRSREKQEQEQSAREGLSTPPWSRTTNTSWKPARSIPAAPSLRRHCQGREARFISFTKAGGRAGGSKGACNCRTCRLCRSLVAGARARVARRRAHLYVPRRFS